MKKQINIRLTKLSIIFFLIISISFIFIIAGGSPPSNSGSISIKNISSSWRITSQTGAETNLTLWTSGTDKKVEIGFIIKPNMTYNTVDKCLFNSDNTPIKDNKNKSICLKYETAKCGGLNCYHISLTDAQAVNINDYIKLGNQTIIIEYQELSTVEYIYDDLTINTTLERCDLNRENCGIAYPSVMIVDSSKLKFGAEDTGVTNDSEYHYRFVSTKPFNKDINYYIETGKVIDGGLFAIGKKYKEIVKVDTNDICSWNLSNCNFMTSENNGTYYLDVYFKGFYNSTSEKVFIDPQYTLSELIITDTINNNVTVEGNFSHLDISSTAPYDSLVAYWSFDVNNNSNGITYDNSKYDNDGTVYGNPVYNTSCPYGNCYSFDGSDDYVSITNAVSNKFDASESYTWSAWIYPRASNFGIISKPGTQKGYSIYLSNAKFCISDDIAGATESCTTQSISLNQWTHIAINYTNQKVGFFINGTSVKTATFTDFADDTATVVYIGYSGSPDMTNYANGLIDEVMIFNSSLTQAQILAIYNNQSARFVSTGTQTLKQFNFTGTDIMRLTETKQTNFNTSISKRLGKWNLAKGYNESLKTYNYWFNDVNAGTYADGYSDLDFYYNNPFSISSWIYIPSSGSGQIDLFSKTDCYYASLGLGNCYYNTGYIIYYDYDTGYVYLFDPYWSSTVASVSISQDTWSHLTVTYDGYGWMNLCIDGSCNGGYGAFYDEYFGYYWWILDPISSYAYNFRLDDLMYFASVLDAGNISYLEANRGLTSTYSHPDIVRHWRFEQTGIDDVISSDLYIYDYAGELIAEDKYGLVGYWHLDSDYNDAFGINNGTASGGVNLNSAGVWNQSASFDGDGDFITISLSAKGNSTSFWYKNSTQTSWTHIAFNTTTYFINGVVGTPAQYPLNFTTTQVKIGVNGSTYFNGSIDEVMIYNRSLSTDEIKELYIKGKANYTYSDYQTSDYFTGNVGYTNFLLDYNLSSATQFYTPYLSATSSSPIELMNSTNITQCLTITEPGSYKVINNISETTSPCIYIASNDVTLDCQNNNVKTSGSASLYITKNNTVITNCNFTGGNYGGLFASGSYNGTIQDSFFTGLNSYSLYLNGGSGYLVKNITIPPSSSSSTGIYLSGSGNNRFYNITIQNVSSGTSYGIYITGVNSKNNTFDNINITSKNYGVNVVSGIDTNYFNNLDLNVYGTGSTYGFYSQSNVTISNVLVRNGYNGLWVITTSIYVNMTNITTYATQYGVGAYGKEAYLDNITTYDSRYGLVISATTPNKIVLNNFNGINNWQYGISSLPTTNFTGTNINITSNNLTISAGIYQGSNSANWYIENLTINILNGSGIRYNNAKISNSIYKNINISSGVGYDLNFLKGYDNITFIDSIMGSYNLTAGNITFTNSTYGSISLLNINGTGGNLFGNSTSDIRIGNNTAYVNSSVSGLNKSANITLYNLPTNFNSPVILRDGLGCSPNICKNFTSLNAGNVTFNVTGWSNYSISSSNLTATLLTPSNNSYYNTNPNFTANLSDNTGLNNASLFIYNSNNSLINQTWITSISGTLNSVVGVVVNLVDGVYKWFYQVFNLAGDSFTTQNNTLTVDTINPQLEVNYPINGSSYGFNGPINLTLNATASDSSGISSMWYNVDGGSNVSFTNITGIVLSVLEGTSKNFIINVWVNDSVNNINSTSLYITVTQLNPPGMGTSGSGQTISNYTERIICSVLYDFIIDKNNNDLLIYNYSELKNIKQKIEENLVNTSIENIKLYLDNYDEKCSRYAQLPLLFNIPQMTDQTLEGIEKIIDEKIRGYTSWQKFKYWLIFLSIISVGVLILEYSKRDKKNKKTKITTVPIEVRKNE